jgi:trimeric autotransporter adhesin
MFAREQDSLPGRAVGLKTPQTGETVHNLGIGGSAGFGRFGARFGGTARATRAARSGRSARRAFALTLGLSALVALGLAGSASAADDPLGAVAQGAASAAAGAAPTAAPTVTTATAGATETAGATSAAVQTATKAVHAPTPPADHEVSETVRSAGAAVDSAVRTAKRTADSAVATTTRVVNDATRPPAATAAHTPATHAARAGLKVEASHARAPSRHPGVTHRRTAEPRTSPATAARALDFAPKSPIAAPTARRDLVSSPAATSGGERAADPQPLTPTAPLHGGAGAAGASAAVSGAGIAALLLATFLLAAPAIRRRLLAPSPGHWPAAPVFLLEHPG